jgi:hypothetical protein
MILKKPMTPEDARRDHRAMLRFLALNAAFGLFLGLCVAGLLIWVDAAGLGSLIRHAENPILPVLLLAVPMALVFSASVTASAIWLMPYDSKFAPPAVENEDSETDDQ